MNVQHRVLAFPTSYRCRQEVAVKDASSLGIPAGLWPASIIYDGRVYGYRSLDVDGEGDVLAGRYEDASGRRLVALND